MKFFTKFFRSLNSADSSKFMVLAISLGIISGFLPTFNVLNVLILFIVFIFRIPMGLFFASSTFFYFIGYLSDYLFHKIGLVVLKAGFLQPLWDGLYNTPFMRWTNFNNTITMGSLISGVVLSIIVYFVLNKSILKYREMVFPKLANIKLLKWIVPNEEKKGIFRLSGLISFGIIFGFFGWVIITFTDPLAKAVLIFGMEKIFHKPVYIQSVNVSFKNLSIDIKNLSVDTTRIDNIHLKLKWNKFVWKKYDVSMLIKSIHLKQSVYKEVLANKQQTHSKIVTTQKTNNKFSLNSLSNLKLPKDFMNSNLKDKVQKYITEVKSFYNKYKKYLPKKEKKVEYIRGKGVYILFKDKTNYPSFVLNNGDIKILDPNSIYEIKISNLASNQKMLAKKAILELSSTSKFYKNAKIKITYLNKINFSGFINGVRLHNLKAKKLIINGYANIKFKGNYKNDINMNIFADIMHSRLKYESSNKILDRVLKSIKNFNINIFIKGQNNIKISSNIDKTIGNSAKNILKDEINKQKKRLNKKIQEEKTKIQNKAKKEIQNQLKGKLNGFKLGF